MFDWVICFFWYSRCMFFVVEGSFFNILLLNDFVQRGCFNYCDLYCEELLCEQCDLVIM